MSIVAVHGPQTFGSKAVQAAAKVIATVSPTDGSIWTFRLDGPTTRANADFVWTYTPAGGAPTSPINSVTTTTIDFTTDGSKVVTLTVTGAGTGANPYPPAGGYPITISSVAGAPAGASLRSLPGGGGGEEEEEEEEEITEEVPVGYDPAAHSVGEVQEYVTEHPEQAQAMYDAEVAGKNRTTLVSWLEEQIPYDPGEYTIDEVKEYVGLNPGEVEDVLAAEEAGKNRVTLVAWLEDFDAS